MVASPSSERKTRKCSCEAKNRTAARGRCLGLKPPLSQTTMKARIGHPWRDQTPWCSPSCSILARSVQLQFLLHLRSLRATNKPTKHQGHHCTGSRAHALWPPQRRLSIALHVPVCLTPNRRVQNRSSPIHTFRDLAAVLQHCKAPSSRDESLVHVSDLPRSTDGKQRIQRATSRRSHIQLSLDGTSIHLAAEDHGCQQTVLNNAHSVGNMVNATISRGERCHRMFYDGWHVNKKMHVLMVDASRTPCQTRTHVRGGNGPTHVPDLRLPETAATCSKIEHPRSAEMRQVHSPT